MVDKVYALRVRYTDGVRVLENILHFSKFSAGDPTNPQFLAVANAWKEVSRAQQTTAITWVDWQATQVLGDGVTYDVATCKQIGGTVQGGVLTGTLAGAAGTDPLPYHDTMSVNFNTGLRGRSYHGRVQLGGFTEQNQASGLWTAGIVSGIQTNLDTFWSAYGVGGSDTNFRWGVFSRGIASGCFPDQNTRHHPLVHRQAGNAADAFHGILGTLASSRVTTTRSRMK